MNSKSKCAKCSRVCGYALKSSKDLCERCKKIKSNNNQPKSKKVK